MTTLTRNGPCPCGSGVKYKKCCLAKTEAVVACASHEARNLRERPLSKMMQFAAPLLDAAGEDRENLSYALTLAMGLWNLALCKRAHYDETLASLTRSIVRNEDEANAFRATAATMVERHRRMFPELHSFR